MGAPWSNVDVKNASTDCLAPKAFDRVVDNIRSYYPIYQPSYPIIEARQT